MTARVERVELYRDRKAEWRWRFIANNGVIVGASTEGYKRRGGAVRNLEAVVDPHSRGVAVYVERLNDGVFELVG